MSHARRSAAALLFLVPLLAGPSPASAAAVTYSLDANHSEVSFQIRHLVSRVRGVFRDFDADIVRDDADPAASSVVFRIQAASIDTGHERRDNHLRSADFFDVASHPEILFRSTKVERLSDSEYRVTGGLTMRGRTKLLTLPVTFDGEMEAPGGGVAAAFSTATKLDRREFGIDWNRSLAQGGLVLGDEAAIEIHLSVRRVSPGATGAAGAAAAPAAATSPPPE